MNKPAKLIRIGNSVGVVIPKEELDRLHLGVGDVFPYQSKPNGIEFSVRPPEFDQQMDEARKVMKRYRNALSELAK